LQFAAGGVSPDAHAEPDGLQPGRGGGDHTSAPGGGIAFTAEVGFMITL